MHIPTTGGRSIVPPLKAKGLIIHPYSNEHLMDVDEALDFVKQCDERNVSRTVNVVEGHISGAEIRSWLKLKAPGYCQRPLRVVIWLREPMARARSWLQHEADAWIFDEFQRMPSTGELGHHVRQKVNNRQVCWPIPHSRNNHLKERP
eukprot:6026452-Amphidinium_carterae.1